MSSTSEYIEHDAEQIAARAVMKVARAAHHSFADLTEPNETVSGEIVLVVECWSSRGDVVAPGLSAAVATWQLAAGAGSLAWDADEREDLDEIMRSGESWMTSVVSVERGSLKVVLARAVAASHRDVVTAVAVYLTILASLSQVTGVSALSAFHVFGDEISAEEQEPLTIELAESPDTPDVLRARVGHLQPGTSVSIRFLDEVGERHGASVTITRKPE